MSIYLSKMVVHDYFLSGCLPSLVAIGSFYVALKISEQLHKISIIDLNLVRKLVSVSQHDESDIIEISRKILYLAQNFDKAFPNLENLKKSHFQQIAVLVP